VGQFISRKRLESGALWLAYQPGRRRPRPSRRPKRSRWAASPRGTRTSTSVSPRCASQANRWRNRTARLRDRDEHGPRGRPGPEPAVSGSDTPGPAGQDPAESRDFSGGSGRRSGSLRSRGLDGGGRRRSRTRL
jgi:hypothetical protein